MRIRGTTVGPVDIARRRCHEKSALVPSLTSFHIGRRRRRRRQRAARCLHMRDSRSLAFLATPPRQSIARPLSQSTSRSFRSISFALAATAAEPNDAGLHGRATGRLREQNSPGRRGEKQSRPSSSRPFVRRVASDGKRWSPRGRDTGSRDFVRSTR